MNELICHLFGDYVFQNHWMAVNKTRASAPCLAHVALYTLPFLLVTRSPAAVAVIFGTHFLIDRFSLAKRWPAFWGVGCEGFVCRAIRLRRQAAHDREAWSAGCASQSIPAPDPAPVWLGVWLGIIVDNTFHLLINRLAIAYF